MIWYAGYFCQDRRVLQSISVTSLPTKTNYNYGDALSTSGMVVTASYSNGRTKVVSGWKCSPTTLNGYGNQTITVTYVDGKVTATTTFTVEVAYLGYLTVPTVSGSFTYSGSTKSPTISGYNSSTMTQSGTTSSTNAGTYYVYFTPKTGYAWSDGTTARKSCKWTIAKASCQLTLSSYSGMATETDHVLTFDISYVGGGTVSLSAANVGGLFNDLSLSGNTVNVDCKTRSGSVIDINVKVAATTNYAAGSAVFKHAYVPTSPWATVNMDVFSVAAKMGVASQYWSLGTNIAISYKGYSYQVRIIGFDHDTPTNPTSYGRSKAGITFFAWSPIASINTNTVMNSSATNSGGWQNSYARNTTMSGALSEMLNKNSGMAGCIVPVNKITGIGSGSSSTTTTSENCFFLSEMELSGSYSNSVYGEGSQYAWFRDGNSKNYEEMAYWLRSPAKNSSSKFCYVLEDGTVSTAAANETKYYCFAFCV